MRASVSLAMLVATGVVVGAAACGSSSNKGGNGTSTGTGGTGGGVATGGATTTTSTTTSTTTATGTATVTGTNVAPSSGHTSGCVASMAAPAPATKFPFPPVVSLGDPVITAPKIVSVTFSNESAAPDIAAFGDALASTCYWDAIRAGYCGSGGTNCIGDGPTGVTIGLSTPPAASYTDPTKGGGTLQTFLQGLITAKVVPAPDDNTIYAIYFPGSTTIDQDGAQSCQDFDGYHSSLTIGSQTVFYAVIPECTAPQMTPQITTFQNTTLTASHEAIETATDGNVNGQGGYYLDVDNSESTWGWEDVQYGGEVADLCVDPFLLGLDEFSENGFTGQRIWSINNASAGKNPCVPIPAGEVYFNAFPDKTALVMDVGTSQTLTVHAQADGTMPAWTLLPQDWTDYTGQTTYLSFSFGDGGPTQTQVQSGDTVSLTVTLTTDPSQTQTSEADGVLVSANSADPNSVTAAHFWPFVVITTAQAKKWGATEQRHTPRHHAKNRRTHRRYRKVFGGFW